MKNKVVCGEGKVAIEEHLPMMKISPKKGGRGDIDMQLLSLSHVEHDSMCITHACNLS